MPKSVLNKRIDEIFKRLKDAEIKRSQFVSFMEQQKNPYIVLIACILSLRTNDSTTYPATVRMLELAKTPQEMMNVSEEALSKAIYPVGFYNNKAKQIIKLSEELVNEYNGEVPPSIDEMLKFDGVGRKTANLVMAKGFGLPAICVDVHVHRIFNRLGLVKTKNPEETEMELRRIIPEKYWIDLNTEFVTLGQNICRPQKPCCEKCPVCAFCDLGKNQVNA
ncbi:MAG: endonuclease III [Candidatus Gastranaerophilales bacterium]|nr:endonuclease III [Candidatus Gastranaerophilales bacterium]